MIEKIYLYYTNDLHSDFTYWPNVVTYFNNEKKKRKRNNESFYLVDIGDHLDRVNPITEAFMGKANVELLNDAQYDIVTIGNNEGITLAHHELYHLYDEANFQVVCSNLHSQKGLQPHWLQKFVQLESNKGVKIGIIGLTAPFNPFYHLLDWHVDQPIEVIDSTIDHLSKQTDVIVLLSHLGINEDRQIAEKFPQIDVIIGGHTHHLLKTGEKINQTTITAAGKHCSHIGEVILTWDHQQNKLINNEAYVTNITHIQRDKNTEDKLKQLKIRAKDKLSTPIITVEEQLDVDWFSETKIIKKLTETLHEWTNAECAMLNAGLLLESFQPGLITHEDVHRICPHPINPVVVELTGRELKEVVRASRTEELMNLPLKGFGFRGKVIGKMIFSGIHIELAEHKQEKTFVKNIYINNRQVKDNQIYSVATADMFMFGRLLPEVAKSVRKDLFLPEFIRDLLVHTLRTKINN